MLKNDKLLRKSEKGNALFLILIAVALFAALSYAVTQSGRTSGSIDRETAMIAASQITQYPSTLDTAITRMIITGTPASEIHFGHMEEEADGVGAYNSTAKNNVDSEGNVFAAAGGAATRTEPPSNIGLAQGDFPYQGTLSDHTWGYKDITDAANGYYIEDVGTNTDVTGRESLAYLHSINIGVCEQINKGLNLDVDPIPSQLTAVDYENLNNGTGNPVFAENAANVFAAMPEEPFGCFENGSGSNVYDYYHALIEQ